MKRKFMSLLIVTALSASLLMGCSGEEKAKVEAEKPAAASSSAEVANVDFSAQEPVIVTSFGQSADAAMLKAVMSKTGVQFEYNNTIKADELGDQKTMVIAVGASSKGLGAAGIKPEDEKERAKAVIAKAKEKGMKIIVAHIGGESRRGKLSDEFIDEGLAGADYIVVVESGNKDSKFTNFAAEKNIPVSIVKSIAKAGEPLKSAFGK